MPGVIGILIIIKNLNLIHININFLFIVLFLIISGLLIKNIKNKLHIKKEANIKEYCVGYKMKILDYENSDKLNSLLVERSKRTTASYIVISLYSGGGVSPLLLICGEDRDVEKEKEIIETIVGSTMKEVRLEPDRSITEYIKINKLKILRGYNTPLRLPTYIENNYIKNCIYKIGWRLDTPLPEPVYLCEEDIEGHIGIYGSTGSGKSTTLRKISDELMESGWKIIIIDWTGEHTASFKNKGLHVIDPRWTLIPINTFLRDVTGRQTLAEILADALGLSEPQTFMLSKIIEKIKLNNLKDIVSAVEIWPEESNWDREVKRGLYRKIILLKNLNYKNIYTPDRSAIVDISRLNSPRLKRLYAMLLITYLNYIKRKDFTGKILLVIDEAHNLFFGESKVLEDILSESRKYGLHVIYATQAPSLIPERIFLNTNTKIVHALRSQKEKIVIQNTMSLNERFVEILDKLSKGEAILQSPSIPKPILVKINP